MKSGQTPTIPYDADFYRSDDHFRHAGGELQAPLWQETLNKLPAQETGRINNRLKYCRWTDRAWTVMLHRQGLIDDALARKILAAIREDTDERGMGGEFWLREKLDGDGDAAAAINIGRTLQEPMVRLQMRDKLLDLIDAMLDICALQLEQADEHVATLMQGQSHMSAAQPITYAQYLIAVHDGLLRGLDLLEVAYRHTNECSAGCGACSGTGYPVDRQLVSDLLGFDRLVEPVFDCEASQDQMVSVMQALSHIFVLISRAGMDYEIWSTHEHGCFGIPGAWSGCSSFMPQKAHAGIYEHLRIKAAHVIGQTSSVVTCFKGEPMQDMLTIISCAWNFVVPGMCQAESGLRFFQHLLERMIPDPERMMANLLTEYSGAPDLQAELVRNHSYGLRRAHKVIATTVRLARDRQILPADMTGALVDEAARMTGESEPGLDDATVRAHMCFERFFENHCNTGDPCPSEGTRMVAERRERLAARRAQHDARKQQVTDSMTRLAEAMDAIIGQQVAC